MITMLLVLLGLLVGFLIGVVVEDAYDLLGRRIPQWIRRSPR